jgi:hypothetical protein
MVMSSINSAGSVFNELHDSWEKENNLKCNDLVQIYLKEKSEKGVKNKFFVIRFFF